MSGLTPSANTAPSIVPSPDSALAAGQAGWEVAIAQAQPLASQPSEVPGPALPSVPVPALPQVEGVSDEARASAEALLGQSVATAAPGVRFRLGSEAAEPQQSGPFANLVHTIGDRVGEIVLGMMNDPRALKPSLSPNERHKQEMASAFEQAGIPVAPDGSITLPPTEEGGRQFAIAVQNYGSTAFFDNQLGTGRTATAHTRFDLARMDGVTPEFRKGYEEGLRQAIWEDTRIALQNAATDIAAGAQAMAKGKVESGFKATKERKNTLTQNNNIDPINNEIISSNESKYSAFLDNSSEEGTPPTLINSIEKIPPEGFENYISNYKSLIFNENSLPAIDPEKPFSSAKQLETNPRYYGVEAGNQDIVFTQEFYENHLTRHYLADLGLTQWVFSF